MKRVALALGLLSFACRPLPDDPDATASPQASAVPAPLGVVPQPSAGLGAAGSTPLLPMRADLPLPIDALAKESTGYSLTGQLRLAAPPPLVRSGEVAGAVAEAARKKTEGRLAIDFGASRLRIALEGGFLLPDGAEVRARSDRTGHVVLIPDELAYHIAAPGSLRTVFAERRFDVSPIQIADLTPLGEGGRRLGLRTRKVVAEGRAGRATFEIAKVADAGDGGVLLCRALLELLAAHPATPLCATDEVPLHAEFSGARRGGFVFDVLSIVRRLDLPAVLLATPPLNAHLDVGPLADPKSALALPPQEIAPLHVGGEAHGVPEKDRTTLLLGNTADSPRVVWLDGVPIGWLAPGGRLQLFGLVRGHYAVEFRSFFDDVAEPPRTVTLPATVEAGGRDGGA